MDLLKQVEQFELIPNQFFDKFAGMPTFFTLIVIFKLLYLIVLYKWEWHF